MELFAERKDRRGADYQERGRRGRSTRPSGTAVRDASPRAALAEATAYRTHCSCVYAAVVRAAPAALRELAAPARRARGRPGARGARPRPGGVPPAAARAARQRDAVRGAAGAVDPAARRGIRRVRAAGRARARPPLRRRRPRRRSRPRPRPSPRPPPPSPDPDPPRRRRHPIRHHRRGNSVSRGPHPASGSCSWTKSDGAPCAQWGYAGWSGPHRVCFVACLAKLSGGAARLLSGQRGGRAVEGTETGWGGRLSRRRGGARCSTGPCSAGAPASSTRCRQPGRAAAPAGREHPRAARQRLPGARVRAGRLPGRPAAYAPAPDRPPPGYATATRLRLRASRGSPSRAGTASRRGTAAATRYSPVSTGNGYASGTRIEWRETARRDDPRSQRADRRAAPRPGRPAGARVRQPQGRRAQDHRHRARRGHHRQRPRAGVLAWDDNELRGTLGLRAGSARHARTIRHLVADLAEVEAQHGYDADRRGSTTTCGTPPTARTTCWPARRTRGSRSGSTRTRCAGCWSCCAAPTT